MDGSRRSKSLPDKASRAFRWIFLRNLPSRASLGALTSRPNSDVVLEKSLHLLSPWIPEMSEANARIAAGL